MTFFRPYEQAHQTTTLFLIGDQSSNKSPFYRYLQLEEPEDLQETTLTIKQLSQNKYIQIYDFPTDKILRPALELYFRILGKPELIVYFLRREASEREMGQWIGLLKESHLSSRLHFISEADCYLEREKVIGRLAKQFSNNSIQNISFIAL